MSTNKMDYDAKVIWGRMTFIGGRSAKYLSKSFFLAHNGGTKRRSKEQRIQDIIAGMASSHGRLFGLLAHMLDEEAHE